MKLNGVHHIAVICSDYKKSRRFYTEILGLAVIREVYRQERDSWKLDLSVAGQYAIELFSFPDPPKRPSYPEAAGLRHLAFAVDNIETAVMELNSRGVATEPLRVDNLTGKKCTFFSDPDGLPLELYEA